MEEKQCRRCKEFKAISAFSLNRTRKDGHQKYCKECNKYLNRKYKERKACKEGRTMKPYEPKAYSTVSDDELLQFIRDFYNDFKRAPTTSDFENNPKYPHFKTYYRHFKYYKEEDKASSWNDILELSGVSPINMRDLWSAWQYLVEKAAMMLEGDCLFQYCGFSLDFKPDIYIPSKNKIIDAATSDYRDPHKLLQYKKSMLYVDTVEYWCLNRNNIPGYDLPNLKYLFADDIIARLQAIGEDKLCSDITNLYQIYDSFSDSYISHRKDYIITKFKEFHSIHGRAPYHRELLNNYEYPSAASVTNIFGSLNNAIIASGLSVNRKTIPKFDEATAINDLKNFIIANNRLPKTRELGPPTTTFTNKVYSKYWGGITNCSETLGSEFLNTYITKG